MFAKSSIIDRLGLHTFSAALRCSQEGLDGACIEPGVFIFSQGSMHGKSILSGNLDMKHDIRLHQWKHF